MGIRKAPMVSFCICGEGKSVRSDQGHKRPCDAVGYGGFGQKEASELEVSWKRVLINLVQDQASSQAQVERPY